MKRIFTAIIALMATVVATAQISGSGYYRVKNNKTARYIYICDGTSSGINVATTSVDMGAVQLWKDNNLLTNPASVIYAEKVDSKWNLSGQGTGVYQLINYYVDVTGSDEKNAYQVSATAEGMTFYLYDAGTGTSNRSQLTTGTANGSLEPAYRVWNVHPMNNDDNYIGVAPAVTVGSKHYSSYYTSFPFSFYSSGMKAYYIKKIDTELGIAVLAEITGIVPSSTPLLIECSSTDAAENKLKLEDYNSYKDCPSDNNLKGVYFANKYRVSSMAYTEYDSSTMRVLSTTSDGRLAFVTPETEEQKKDLLENISDKWSIKANTAYLKVSANSPKEMLVMNEEEYENAKKVKVSSITLNYTAAELPKGETLQLTATIAPENADNKSVTWTSSNNDIATVDDNGLVTAIALGNATITAKAADGSDVTAACEITVTPVYVTSINLNETEIELTDGGSFQLEAEVLPENAVNKSLQWTTSSSKIATVSDDGLVTMKKEGRATITVRAQDGSNVSAKCHVTCTTTQGITEITVDEIEEIYSIDGKRQTTLRKGLNIVRGANGKVIKVVK